MRMISADTLSIVQEGFLVVSNLSILPSVALALYNGFYAEGALLFLLMSSSSLYHFCDGERLHYCILEYRTLQFLDFYCAIYSFWCIAIVLAAVPDRWRSLYHITGAVFLGGLLTNCAVGVTTFVVPLLAIALLIGVHWIHFHRIHGRLPMRILTVRFILAAALILCGVVCFAIQQNEGLHQYYGFIHSFWHIFMAFALLCLLPKSTAILYESFGYKLSAGQKCINEQYSDTDKQYNSNNNGEEYSGDKREGEGRAKMAPRGEYSAGDAISLEGKRPSIDSPLNCAADKQQLYVCDDLCGRDAIAYIKPLQQYHQPHQQHHQQAQDDGRQMNGDEYRMQNPPQPDGERQRTDSVSGLNNEAHSLRDRMGAWCKTILAQFARPKHNPPAKHSQLNLNV